MRSRACRRHRRDRRGSASRARPRRRQAGAADDLRGRVADRGLQRLRPGPAVQLRGLEHARDADPERRAGGHLRLGGAAQHAAPLPSNASSRGRSRSRPTGSSLIVPRSNPAGIHSRVRPAAQAGEARDRRRRGAGRRLHAHGAAQDGADVGALEGREPGVRREGRDRQGRARPGRRRLRLRRPTRGRSRPGDRDPDPGLGAAARPLRDRRRVEVDEQGGRAGMDQEASSRRGDRRRSKNAGFLPIPKASR